MRSSQLAAGRPVLLLLLALPAMPLCAAAPASPPASAESPTRQSLRRSGYGSPTKAESRYGDGAATAGRPAVEYTIEATLEPQTKTIDGKERLLWRNPSDDAVGELRFHMYLNAFKNNRSTFMRESGGLLRGGQTSRKPEEWGSIDVLSMKTADGRDLKPLSRFIQPDGNDLPSPDETVLLVPLPSPVPPRGEILLDIRFRSKLPRVFARTGYVRNFYLVGQWFPKIGVYEPAGMRGRAQGGWNCHAFHANSEFYADYGRYDVTFTVPSSYVVGATGKRFSEVKRGDRTTYRYVQGSIHDFAWTADPRYVVHEFQFDPARDIPAGWGAKAARELGLTEAEIALKPVAVRLLLQPDHLAARERYVRSVKQALSFYGLWFGAYPYETLTIVDPPDDGLGAGGVEYPTFVTSLAPSVLLRWPFQDVRILEQATIHEIGHQYWYGMVGSNEFEESWLDEGLNTDSEYRAMAMAYGPREFAEFPGSIGIDSLSLAHARYAGQSNLDPIRRFAWNYASRSSYGVNSYPKVGLFLAQLRNDLGGETFARAERTYFQEWAFRHPSTSDFFDVFERVSGRDLSTYRRNLVEGTSRLDWSVVSAESRRASQGEALFDRPEGRVAFEGGRPVRPEKKEGKAERKAGKEKQAYESIVLFGNLGEWPHEARARLVFEDGKVVDRRLPAEARWVRLRVRYGSKLAWAAVDPDRRNAWEWNRLNDSKVLGSGKGAADTHGRRAAVKYFGWVAYIVGLFTQLFWTLA